MKELIFTVGIPGAGKSTYLRGKYPKVSTDDIRRYILGDVNEVGKENFVFKTAEDIIVNLLKTYDVVYMGATMVETKHRHTFLNAIKSRVKDVKFTGLIFSVDPEESKRRIQKDLNSGINRASSVNIVDKHYKMYLETINEIESNKHGFDAIFISQET